MHDYSKGLQNRFHKNYEEDEIFTSFKVIFHQKDFTNDEKSKKKMTQKIEN